MIPFHITYSLTSTSTGWASCGITLGGEEIECSVTYLHDSLRDLVEGACKLISGEVTECRIIFMDEPGEYVLDAHRLNEHDVHLTLGYAPDWDPPGGRYDLVCEGVVHVREYAFAVFEASNDVLTVHGEAEYLRVWVSHPFPMQAFLRLKALIGR